MTTRHPPSTAGRRGSSLAGATADVPCAHAWARFAKQPARTLLFLVILTLALAPPSRADRRRARRSPTGTHVAWPSSPVALSPLAAAQERVPTDRELSQKYLEKGLARFAAGDYAGALVEFDLASGFLATPALEYQIARCRERLDQPADALVAYERFLVVAPDDPAAPAARERVGVLRQRLAASGGVPKTR